VNQAKSPIRIIFISLLISYASFGVAGFMLFTILNELGIEIDFASTPRLPIFAYFLTFVQKLLPSFLFGGYFAFRMIRYKILGIDCKLDFMFFITFCACFASMIVTGSLCLLFGFLLLRYELYFFGGAFLLSVCLTYALFKRSGFMLSGLLKNLGASFNVDFKLRIVVTILLALIACFMLYCKLT